MALASEAPANLGDIWEQMARISWKNFRPYFGMAGNPIACSDHYNLSDTPVRRAAARRRLPMAERRAGAGVL